MMERYKVDLNILDTQKVMINNANSIISTQRKIIDGYKSEVNIIKTESEIYKVEAMKVPELQMQVTKFKKRSAIWIPIGIGGIAANVLVVALLIK